MGALERMRISMSRLGTPELEEGTHRGTWSERSKIVSKQLRNNVDDPDGVAINAKAVYQAGVHRPVHIRHMYEDDQTCTRHFLGRGYCFIYCLVKVVYVLVVLEL